MTPLEESVEPEEAMEVTPEEDLFYEEEETQAPSILPEEVVLPLPSNIISAKTRTSFKCLISIEMELQKGQAMMLWWSPNLFGQQIPISRDRCHLEHIY